jgi:hypothetical protein
MSTVLGEAELLKKVNPMAITKFTLRQFFIRSDEEERE